MRGHLIVVKGFIGHPLVRRVWDCSARAVYILDEEQWEIRNGGGKSLDPVGFPIEDVFLYDDEARKQLASESPSWNALTRFPPDAKIAA